MHDSRVNLFRYKPAGLARCLDPIDRYWVIGFQRGLSLDKLDCSPSMVLKIAVECSERTSKLIATGREYDLIPRRKYCS